MPRLPVNYPAAPVTRQSVCTFHFTCWRRRQQRKRRRYTEHVLFGRRSAVSACFLSFSLSVFWRALPWPFGAHFELGSGGKTVPRFTRRLMTGLLLRAAHQVRTLPSPRSIAVNDGKKENINKKLAKKVNRVDSYGNRVAK